ncbi:MAG: ATP-dependent Clp protease proteolytic subunit [Verrucomicrobiota bacterium]|nr:ATP-dependent Clp protease proteolytic subunit [Verrucomicrobiota bacterium]
MTRTAYSWTGFLILSFAVAVSSQAPGEGLPFLESSVPRLGNEAEDPAQLSEAPNAELHRQRDQLLLENQLGDEALRKELAEANAQLARYRTASELARARAEDELTLKRIEIDKARLDAEEITTRLSLESAREQASMQSELAGLRAAKERAELESALANAEFSKKASTFRAQEIAWNAKLVEMKAKLAEREKELEFDSYAEQRPIYLKDPLTPEGSLVLSDRRIPLNGPITMSTADVICARIDYFNNKTAEYPIFLVIDDSPGGSVMAGYKILKSMQSSSAPVYVVVKSFAASVAAAITALAERSFAYPTAVIVHHQISAGATGNLTVQREHVKSLDEWWRRLADPIAAKMGITTDEFVKRMYAQTASGDWKEFADDAARLKWVDVVIGRCQETARIRNPDRDKRSEDPVAAADLGTADAGGAQVEKAGAKGRPSQLLPRLNPADCYYLYNPDGYFRIE